MKNLWKKNQTIVSALAVMLAVAGYLTWAGSTDLAKKANSSATYTSAQYELSQEDLLQENSDGLAEELADAGVTDQLAEAETSADAAQAAAEGSEATHLREDGLGSTTDGAVLGAVPETQEAAAADASADDGLTDIASLDQDASDLEDVPGEAVLTSGMTVSDFVAKSKLTREQVRGANKEALLDVINNEAASEDEVQGAIDSMVALTNNAEKENAAELLLKSKGFEESIVSIQGNQVEVMIGRDSLTDAELAQVEDAVKRKTETGIENIVISLMDVKK